MNRSTPPLARAVDVLLAGTKAAMLSAFVAMIVLTLVQVANRFLIGAPIFWTEELIVLLLVWSVLLGLPVQLWQHEEILVDVWPARTPAGQRLKRGVAGALSAGFCALLAYAGWFYAARGVPVTSPALGLSRLWFFLPIPLCAALGVLALVVRPGPPDRTGDGGSGSSLGLDS